MFDDTVRVGLELRAAIKRAGDTQVSVAQAFNVSQPWISRILNGQFGSRSSLVQALCRQYRVEEYAHNSPQQAALAAIEEKLLRLWDGTPEGYSKLHDLLEALLALKDAGAQQSEAAADVVRDASQPE